MCWKTMNLVYAANPKLQFLAVMLFRAYAWTARRCISYHHKWQSICSFHCFLKIKKMGENSYFLDGPNYTEIANFCINQYPTTKATKNKVGERKNYHGSLIISKTETHSGFSSSNINGTFKQSIEEYGLSKREATDFGAWANKQYINLLKKQAINESCQYLNQLSHSSWLK